MKLNYNTFKHGVEILTCSYLDWKFNPADEKMMATWYSRLINMISEEDFLSAVNYYTRVMDKGPNSPLALKKPYAEKCLGNYMTPVEALNALRELLKACDLDTDDNRVVESLMADKSYRPLYVTYLNMKHLGYQDNNYYCNSNLNSKFGDSYICTWFITEYKKNLQEVIEQNCNDRIAALPISEKLKQIEG